MDQRSVSDTWERGDPYERYIGRWSRQVAPKFLAWMNCAHGLRWLDVGCGTGALSAAIVDHASPLSVSGVEPAQGFLKTARENLAEQVTLYEGSATAIPLESSSVDVVVSGLVLNFVPDQHAALVEMQRVARAGGEIGVYVWDYAGKMELIRLFWDAAAELDPDAARLDEGFRFPVCSPKALSDLFFKAGLVEIKGTAIDVPTPFANFEDYWQPFLGGQGPAPAYVMSLDGKARERLRESLEKRIPTAADGSIAMTARAWAVRGAVVK
jgi:SAM-dependent methyltransferase